MNVYIFRIQFLNEKNSIEYSIVKGVYDCKETALEEARKSLNAQKNLWPGSYEVQVAKRDACIITALKCKDGVTKTYGIHEVPLNTTL